jgi:hypothetical protein
MACLPGRAERKELRRLNMSEKREDISKAASDTPQNTHTLSQHEDKG